MIRVQTRVQDGAILFIQDDGTSASHAPEFELDGREYYFLGGCYYDLDEALIRHIFSA